jgi:hypothetical protein
MNSYYKYLKYKTKYLQYKNIVGGSQKRKPEEEVEVKKQQKGEELDEKTVCSMLDSYMSEIPGCIWYTILPPELLQRVISQVEDDVMRPIPANYKEYFDFLEDKFPFIKDKVKEMDIRVIETDYNDFENNTSSINWHIDSEKFTDDASKSCYNIICYLKIINNTKKCAVEIFVEKPDEIGHGKKYCLPAIDGLIIIMDDNKLIHKSPIIELQDKTKRGYRVLLRTHVHYSADDNGADREKLGILANQENKKRLIHCLETLQNLKDGERLDCLTLIQYDIGMLNQDETDEIFRKFPGVKTILEDAEILDKDAAEEEDT